MQFLKITKDGIDNVVDEALYEAVYKPAGWKVVGGNAAQTELTKSPEDEIVKKNTIRMRKTKAKKFNDNLIKGECNGEI